MALVAHIVLKQTRGAVCTARTGVRSGGADG